MNENAAARTSIAAVWDYCRTALGSSAFREIALLRLREALTVIALAAGSYYLAKIAWLLFPLPEPAPPAPLAPSLAHPSALQPPPLPPTDLRELKDWRLFGDPTAAAKSKAPAAKSEPPPPPAPKEIDIKDLKLRGVILNPRNPENARASIAQGKDAQWYSVGEQLDDKDAVIESIEKDHVLLRDGELTATLHLFPKKGAGNKEKDAPKDLKVIDLRDNKRATSVAAKYKKRIADKPASLAQLLHFSVVREKGDIVGYRIRPKRSRSDFFALGLKSGDIINSINGVELDSLLSLQTAQSAVEGDTEARLRITRRKKPVELVVKLQ